MGYSNTFDIKELDGHWITVLSEYGIHVDTKPGKPCPACGGDNRFHYTNRHNNGTWLCRKCREKGGTGFTLLQMVTKRDSKELMRELAERYGTSNMKLLKKEPQPTVKVPGATIPAPHEMNYVPNTYVSIVMQKTGAPKSFQYDRMFPWKTVDNQLVGYVGRQPSKICHQIFWTNKGWTQGSLGQGRPLFGLETLAIEGPVYVVEGEKTQAAAQERLNAAVITWTGGANTVKASDWSVIKGREVVLCPDNDEPGFKAMNYVKQVLSAGNEIVVFTPSEELPEHWDLADLDESVDMREYINQHSKSQQKVVEEQKQVVEANSQSLLKDIRPLGFDKEKLFFLPAGKLQVIELNANTLGKGQLRSLADMDKWREVFPKDSLIDPVNWDSAANWVIRECEKKKVYDQANIRGNGIWLDKMETVVHMGDHLLVGGQRIELNQYDSKYVYAQRPRKLSAPKVQIDEHDKELLVRIVNRFNWAEKSSATMLLSFILAAPLAGRLHWRPSVWINGPKGAGKSTILEWFVKPCLAGLHIGVEGETTEAGIRQTIGCDALPVLFDEPEGDTLKACEALQKIIRLIRSSASGSTSMITKGSASGAAVHYQAQCMFLLASINVVTLSPQDKDRISILELEHGRGPKDWKSTEALLHSIPEDMSMKLIDFIIREHEWILNVIKVFCDFVSKKTGSQRIGDQYGILSIGEYILMNEPGKIPEDKEIAKHIDNKLWGSIQTNNKDTNETDFVSYLANILLQIEDGDTGRRKELSLRECFDIANDTAPFVFESMKKNVIAAIGRRGILVKDGKVSFVRNSHNLLKLFLDKPQFSNYVAILKRLPGAEDRRIRLGGSQFYAVSVPLTLFGEQNWLEADEEWEAIEPILENSNDEIAW